MESWVIAPRHQVSHLDCEEPLFDRPLSPLHDVDQVGHVAHVGLALVLALADQVDIILASKPSLQAHCFQPTS